MSRTSARPRPGRAGAGGTGAQEPASGCPACAEPAASPFPDASPEARRLAATILEVLAGTQLPAEAAGTLGLSLARYYQLELRAVAGLVAACEPRRRGRGRPAEGDLVALRRECERLRRECARQQALVRAARRAVGLTGPPPTPPPAEGGRKRRRRRPTARALKMAALLQPPAGGPSPAAPPAPEPEAPAGAAGGP
jgi:hypothetical protein